MSPKHVESPQSSVESCALHLLLWRPFHTAGSKTLDSSPEPLHKPYGSHSTPKRPCLSDRSTAFSIEALSRLSLADDDNGARSSYKRGGFRPVERKRRRRGSRSVSGRSSSVGAQVTTCSEIQFAIGTDSSGELFCESNWASDVSEAKRYSRRDRDSGEKEGGGVFGFGIGVVEPMGNESGYGSEPGYRGDAEIGYGDEEEEDSKLLFWGVNGSGFWIFNRTDLHLLIQISGLIGLLERKTIMVEDNYFRDTESSKEICAEEEKELSDKKSHYRCRRGLKPIGLRENGT